MDSKQNLEQVVGEVTGAGAAPSEPAAPVTPVASAAPVAPADSTSKKDDVVFKDKSSGGKGMLYGMILCMILAVGGIGFGVWTMMDGNSQKEALNQQVSTLEQQISELQEKTDSASAVTPDSDIASDASIVNTADYIYVGEWGLKIKIPEGLSAIGYEFGEGNYGEYLAIAGAKIDSSENLFKYTNIDNFLAGQISKSNSEDGFYPYGTLVYTDSDQNKYYYEGPQADMGSTEEETNAWRAGADLIKEMLMNPENYSKI